jgi:hypothetical protein
MKSTTCQADVLKMGVTPSDVAIPLCDSKVLERFPEGKVA